MATLIISPALKGTASHGLLTAALLLTVLPHAIRSQPSAHAGGYDIHHHHSAILEEPRDIFIALPDRYELTDKSYPTLYILDADWIFDYAAGTAAFLSGSLAGRMPEMILVGIPNTDRNRDMTIISETDSGYIRFMNFLEYELIPFIDSTYRTSNHRVLYGWSSGASIALEMLFTRPHLLDAAVATGVGLGRLTLTHLQEGIAANTFHGKSLYAATEGTTPPRAQSLRRLDSLLTAAQPAGLVWQCHVMDDVEHVGVMPRGLFDGLEFIYNPLRLPTEVTDRGISTVRQYYHDLRASHRLAVEIPEGAFNDAAVHLVHTGRLPDALDLLAFGIDEHPESAVLHDTMGEVLEMAERLPEARAAYERACLLGRKYRDRQLPIYESHLNAVSQRLGDR